MIFRQFGRIFNRTPKKYYEEVFTNRSALVTKCAILTIQAEWSKERYPVSHEQFVMELQQTRELLEKLAKTANVTYLNVDLDKLIELEIGYVKTFMATNS